MTSLSRSGWPGPRSRRAPASRPVCFSGRSAGSRAAPRKPCIGSGRWLPKPPPIPRGPSSPPPASASWIGGSSKRMPPCRSPEAEASTADPGCRDQITAERAHILGRSGRNGVAAALAAPLLDRVSGRALVSACFAAGASMAVTGQTAGAIEASERGLAAHLQLTAGLRRLLRGRGEKEWSPLWAQRPCGVHCSPRAESYRLLRPRMAASHLVEESYDGFRKQIGG